MEASVNYALEIIEQLPLEEQNYLLDILKKRNIEKKRKEIAKHARQARKMYKSGELKPKKAQQVISELRNSLSK